jgi:hypothetical protein
LPFDLTRGIAEIESLRATYRRTKDPAEDGHQSRLPAALLVVESEVGNVFKVLVVQFDLAGRVAHLLLQTHEKTLKSAIKPLRPILSVKFCNLVRVQNEYGRGLLSARGLAGYRGKMLLLIDEHPKGFVETGFQLAQCISSGATAVR